MIATRTTTSVVTTAEYGRRIPADRLRETTGPAGSGRATPAARIAGGAEGAMGCMAKARVHDLVETGAACPPGRSGNPGRAEAAPGPEVVDAGGIGLGGACEVRSSLPAGPGSGRPDASGATPGRLGDA